MLKKKSILIVGASGFIGSYLANELSKYHNVIAYGRSLKKSNLKFFGGKILDIDIYQDQKNILDVDCVINCIALTNTQSGNWKEHYNSNCLTTFSLLKNFSYKRFIQLSSFSVLEKSPLINNQINPTDYYGLSKYLAEKMVEIEYSNEKVFSIIRFPIVIGRHKTHKDFIDYIYTQSMTGGKIELYNKGVNFKDLIHVSEAVKAIISIVNKTDLRGFNTFNVGGLDLLNSLEICEHIIEKTKSKSKITFNENESWSDYDQLLRSSNFLKSKMNLIIKYKCQTIRDNLDFYLDECKIVL